MSRIADLQTDIVARLNADAYFANITVIHERQGDIDNRISRALKTLTTKDSKIGVAVVVASVKAGTTMPDAPGPHFDRCELEITTFEDVLFNASASGTGKAAVDIAVRVAQLLHHYLAGGLGQTLIAGAETIVPLGLVNPDGNTIAYKTLMDVAADCQVLDKCATPGISPAGGAVPQTVTLTCATAGASIYYTLDDSYPWSGNSAATLYAAPFSVAAAATLRAVAHLTDYVASDAAWAEFT